MFSSPSPSSPSAAGAGVSSDDGDVQLLPTALSSQLSAAPRALCHSRAATRLLFVSQPSHATHAILDFQFDVVHVGQIALLLHSWQRIFVQIQQAAPTLSPQYNADADPDEWHTLLLSCSRAYRAELETCLVEAAAQLANPNDTPASAALQAELRAHNIALDDYKYTLLLLETCKSLLHLIEVFYLDPHLNLTAQLVDWTQRTLQMPTVLLSEEEEEAQAEEEPQRSPSLMRDSESYWMCVYRMLLQGRLFEALQMIESCEELMGVGSPYRELMRSVLDAIETVPAIAYRQQQQPQQSQNVSGRNNRLESASTPQVPLEHFLNSFRAWQSALRELRGSEVLAQHPHEHLDMLLQVLLGDEAAMLSAAGSNYLELFLGTLLYVKPHLQNSRREMSDMLQRCMERCEDAWRNSTGATAADDSADSLYTPLDTLRFHLMSSDIASALSVMNTMVDLRFFMAHVVHLLDAQGEVLHHATETEGRTVVVGGRTQTIELPKALRLQHSSIADNITLLEYYLLSYGESLEAASAGVSDAGAGVDNLWLLAVEYYAACHEHGRGYLTNLVRGQRVTLDVVRPSLAGAGAGDLVRRVDHRKVHRLLALCTRFGLDDEYNHVLTMAGNTCMQQGCDAIRVAGATATAIDATSSTQVHIDAGAFGQAAHWYSMLQPDAAARRAGASISRAGVAKLEGLAEILLDQLLLQTTPASAAADENAAASLAAQQRTAFQGMAGVLAHVPGALLLPLDVLLASGDVPLPSPVAPSHSYSPLLTVMSAFYSYRAIWFRMQAAAREAEAIAKGGAAVSESKSNDTDMMMDDGAAPEPAPASAGLPALAALSAHAQLHSQCLSLLVSLVRHSDVLLASQRKYWLPLVAQLVAVVEERRGAAALSPAQKRERRVRRVQAMASQPSANLTFFEMQHPAYAATSAALPPPPAAASAQLPLSVLTQVQRLLTSLLHSHSAKLYSAPIGGDAGIKRLQQSLSALTNQSIQRPLAL